MPDIVYCEYIRTTLLVDVVYHRQKFTAEPEQALMEGIWMIQKQIYDPKRR